MTPDLISAYAYPEPVPQGGWVRACMISSVDGAASGPDGRSGSLGTAADREVFAMLRGLADTILVGRRTAQAEGYELPEPNPDTVAVRTRLGQAPTPTMALVTASGAVPSRLWGSDGKHVRDDAGVHEADNPNGTGQAAPLLMVFTTPAGDALHGNAIRAQWGPHAVQVCSGDAVDPEWALSVLASYGQRRILCEGGPTLLAGVLHAARLNEVCVTIAPHVAGGGALRIVAPEPSFPPAHLRLEHSISAQNTVFTRWTVEHHHQTERLRPADTTALRGQ